MLNGRTIYLALALLILAASGCDLKQERIGTGPKEGAKYLLDHDSARIDWTVQWKGAEERLTGTFDKIAISIPQIPNTPAQLLSRSAIEIYVPLIESNDKRMNSAIVEYFFGKDDDDQIIGAHVVSLNGTEADGKATVFLSVAGSQDTLEMDYAVNGDLLEMWGRMDLKKMGLEDRLKPLNDMFGNGQEIDPYVDLYGIFRFNSL